jgi:hypothetical protein
MLAVAVFFGGACNSTDPKKAEAGKPTASGVPSATISASNLSPFVPMTVGRQWKYQITLRSGQVPLMYRVDNWIVKPRGGGSHAADSDPLSFEIRGDLLVSNSPIKGELVYTVAAEANDSQGPLKLGRGYKLKVDRDDLGVFKLFSELYMAAPNFSKEVYFIGILNPAFTRPPAQGRYENYDFIAGYVKTLVFFAGEDEGVETYSEGEAQKLVFVGEEQCGQEHCMHFIRKVAAGQIRAGVQRTDVYSAFEEHMWYVRDRGMVQLKQIVNNQEVMTWELKQD